MNRSRRRMLKSSLGRALARPGLLASPFTITRAQSGGVLSSALAADNLALDFYGADVPRFDGSQRWLLIEGQRTNLIVGMAAPSTQNVTVTAAAHTLTFYGTGSIALSGTFVGTLNGTGANNRVSLTFTPTAGTLTLTVSGTVTRAQLEVGSFASSYTEISAGTATRGVDAVSATLASLGIPASGAGTYLWSGMIPQNAASPGVVILCVDDGSSSNRFFVENPTGGALLNIVRGTAGVGGSTPIGSMVPGTPFRLGVSIDGAGRAAVSLNGAAPAAVTGGPTSGLTTLRLGNTSTGNPAMFGETAHLRVLPVPVSDATLAALTAALPL